MTEDELRHHERMAEFAVAQGLSTGCDAKAYKAVVAEARRLRGLIKRLEWGSCDGCGIRDVCTECKARKSTPNETTWEPLERHHRDCPVFTEGGDVR
jgi:hypothetical protein